MIKPFAFAATGAVVTLAAYFSGACPPLLTALQLAAYAIVYGAKPVATPSSGRVENFYEYASVGAFLYFAKFYEYWTLGVAGPLARQAAFFPIPLILAAFVRAFSDAGRYELSRAEIAIYSAMIALIPLFALVRPIPSPLGIPVALLALPLAGLHAATWKLIVDKHTEKSAIDVRARVYLAGLAIAVALGFFFFAQRGSRPRSYLWLATFVAACFAHAAARKWHDSEEEKKRQRFADEWSALRAALTLTWAWTSENRAAMLAYAAAVALQAYMFRRRGRAIASETESLAFCSEGGDDVEVSLDDDDDALE